MPLAPLSNSILGLGRYRAEVSLVSQASGFAQVKYLDKVRECEALEAGFGETGGSGPESLNNGTLGFKFGWLARRLTIFFLPGIYIYMRT